MDQSRTTRPADTPVDRAVSRHPASGPAHRVTDKYGMRVVEMTKAATLPVYGDVEHRGAEGVIGYVDLPPVHAQECSRCGALFRIRSPFALTHTLTHRREAWGRKARAALHSVTTLGRGTREAG